VAAEIDPEMVKVATEYFGLKQDERLVVSIGDGLKFISEAAKAGKDS
jgi:spermidine synthase